jgi:uroporphyrinogen III methyltransferase/synthase
VPTPSWPRFVAEQSLSGIRVVVTRPDAQARPLVQALERLGAEAAAVPLVEIEPVEDAATLDAAGAAVPDYDWVVFTSANGVRALGGRLTAHGRVPRVAVVGPATAAAVRELGVEPTLVGESTAGDLARELGPQTGTRLLLLQADIADPELARVLREQGAATDVVTAYRTVNRTPSEAERAVLDQADAIILASGSAARSLAATGSSGAALLLCIGPKTALAAREVGLRVGLVADEATSQGIIRALVEYYGEST